MSLNPFPFDKKLTRPDGFLTDRWQRWYLRLRQVLGDGSGVVPQAFGGTGLSEYTDGDIIYANADAVLARLSIGADGRLLKVASGLPSWAASQALTKVDDTNVTLTLGGSPTTALVNAASITVGWSGTLSVARGGTAIASYAVGDILYASGTTTLSKLADVATGNALISGGIGVAPSWGKIGIGTHVSGLGTNVATFLGTPSSANLAAAVTDETGSGALVFGTAPTLSQPNIVGTTTNNNANAGSVGEYIESVVAAVSFPTTATWGDLTSISLTAGDWDVTFTMNAQADGATVPQISAGIDTNSGTSAAGTVTGSSLLRQAGPTANNNSSVTIAAFRVSLSGTTTYYAKFRADYTVATPTASGRLSARRMR